MEEFGIDLGEFLELVVELVEGGSGLTRRGEGGVGFEQEFADLTRRQALGQIIVGPVFFAAATTTSRRATGAEAFDHRSANEGGGDDELAHQSGAPDPQGQSRFARVREYLRHTYEYDIQSGTIRKQKENALQTENARSPSHSTTYFRNPPHLAKSLPSIQRFRRVGWISGLTGGFNFWKALASAGLVAGAAWVDVAPPSGRRKARPLSVNFQIGKSFPATGGRSVSSSAEERGYLAAQQRPIDPFSQFLQGGFPEPEQIPVQDGKGMKKGEGHNLHPEQDLKGY